ncbi:MAG: acyltransferase [Culicoidibacterales bacterium]
MKQNIGIEYLRVYASLSVIIIHVSALAIRQTASYSYEFPLILDVLSRAAVPLFFMISGYLLLNPAKSGNFKEMWSKTKQRIFVPFLFWLGIYWVFTIVFYWWRFQLASPMTMSAEFFVGETTYHFWFLPVLGIYYLLTPWFNQQLCNRSERQIMLFVIGSFVYGGIMQVLGAWTGLVIFQLLKIGGFTGYFLFGYLTKQKQWQLNIWLGVSGYLLSMALTAIIFASLYKVISPEQTINYITDNFSPLIIIGSCLVFISFVHQTYRETWLKRLTVSLSPYTFGIYFIHVAILSVLASFGELNWFPMISNSLVLILSVYSISLAISYLMKKNRILQRFI